MLGGEQKVFVSEVLCTVCVKYKLNSAVQPWWQIYYININEQTVIWTTYFVVN